MERTFYDEMADDGGGRQPPANRVRGRRSRDSSIWGTSTFFAQFNPTGDGGVDLSLGIGLGAPTFTRATAATAVLANGDFVNVGSGVARGMYTPDGAALGVYIEGESTNIVIRSEDLAAGAWSILGTMSPAVGAATLGTLLLTRLNDDAAGTLEGITQNLTFTGDAVKAISLFVKQETSTSSVIRLRDTTAGADRLLATITWANGVPIVAMTTGTDLTGTPVQYGSSGVFRLLFQTTAVSAANGNQLQIYPATDAALSVANTGFGIFGGVQAEDKEFPTTYIPTLSTAVTRNADVLTYPAAGSADGAIVAAYCEFVRTLGRNNFIPFEVHGGVDTERFGIYRSSGTGTMLGYEVDGGVVNVDQSMLVDATPGVLTKVAGRFVLNDYAFSLNGSAPETDNSGTRATVTTISVGRSINVGEENYALYGAVRNLRFWNNFYVGNDVLKTVTR